MNIILMFIGVLLVVFIVNRVYKKNWTKALKMNVTFEDKNVLRGDKTNLILSVTNAKKLPLPMINTKFKLDPSFIFTNADANSTKTDNVYRNDCFALGPNTKITRKVEILATKRGVYNLSEAQMVFSGIFMDEVNVLKQNLTGFITVYPKAVDVDKIGIVKTRLEGDLNKRKYLFEDKFAFRGIREYNYNDNLKLVNWKASAKQGNLMVNEYDESMSKNVCILLNLEKDRELENLSLLESSIELAAGFANKFTNQRANICLYSNGVDFVGEGEVSVELGSGISHLKAINTVLARIDASKEKRDFKEVLNNLVIDESYVYVIIGANRQKDLLDLINEKFKNSPNSLWLVPVLPLEELKIDTNLSLCKYEVNGDFGGKINGH
ncbi:DUF58 domain-containing protein [Lachnospira multipara]|uniref:DUF58 domain-containing protein n=1 Tax=Lachnospira multipara TaxID=28051 RepID=UPI000481A0DC|nr:DUF58 domain-containing protein [Lachnospira multipara]